MTAGVVSVSASGRPPSRRSGSCRRHRSSSRPRRRSHRRSAPAPEPARARRSNARLRSEMSRRPERGAAFAEPRPTTIAVRRRRRRAGAGARPRGDRVVVRCRDRVNRVHGDRGAAQLPRAAEVTLPVALRHPYAALGSHDGEQPSCKRHQPTLSGSGEFADDRVLAGAVREPGLGRAAARLRGLARAGEQGFAGSRASRAPGSPWPRRSASGR